MLVRIFAFALLVVAVLGSAAAAERVYYIAADAIVWDYAPSYPNNFHQQAFHQGGSGLPAGNVDQQLLAARSHRARNSVSGERRDPIDKPLRNRLEVGRRVHRRRPLQRTVLMPASLRMSRMRSVKLSRNCASSALP